MENNNDIAEFDLTRFLKLLIKNKFIILIFVVAGILFASAVIYFSPKIYQAKTIIEIGNLAGTDASGLQKEISSSFLGKYPFLSVIAVSDRIIIEISNSSANKSEAENGVADVVSNVLLDDSNAKDRIQEQINGLNAEMNLLMSRGQQIAGIYLRLADLQDRLDSAVPTKIVKYPTVLKPKLNSVIIVALGAILGLFVGLVVVSIKGWWQKNKGIIL